MNTLQAILNHPLAFALGLLLLVAGIWLLRKGGLVVLTCLGLSIAAVSAQYLVNAGWITNDLAYIAGVYAVGLVVIVLVNRIEVVARSAELFFTIVLCFAAGRTLAEWLHWPSWAFWCIAITGALFSPVLTVALFSSALLSFSTAASAPWITIPLFVACLLVTRFQHGRWWRTHWDPRLTEDMRQLRGSVGAASLGTNLPVVFASETPRIQARVIGELNKNGIACHDFPGGSAGAEVPIAVLRKWKRQRWWGLLKAQPSSVFSGRSAITIPPVLTESAVEAVSLDRVAHLLRSFDGNTLPGNVATGKGVTLAILDTGVNPVTPALRKALKDRISVVPHEPAIDDQRGHGTPVAACVLAVAPDVRLVSVKVLDETGRGTLFTVLRGLAYVAAHRHEIDAVNLSLGAPCCGGNVCPLCQALRALEKLGIASCCAIGNAGPRSSSVECPGASSGALGVGAVNVDLHVAPFSSRGPCRNSGVKKPDLANFGVNLQMPDHNGNLIVASGTSFASPLTAGSMAACLEVLNKKGNVASLYDLLRSSCIATASDSRDPNSTGRGIANLKRAVEQLGLATKAQWVIRWPVLPYRLLIRTASVTVALVLLAVAWRFGLNHVDALRYELANSSHSVEPSRPARHFESANRDKIATTGQTAGRLASPDLSHRDKRQGQIIERSLTLLGRVQRDHDNLNQFIFDDGSGKAILTWVGDHTTSPESGSVIVLSAEHIVVASNGSLVLGGRSRFQILPHFLPH